MKLLQKADYPEEGSLKQWRMRKCEKCFVGRIHISYQMKWIVIVFNICNCWGLDVWRYWMGGLWGRVNAGFAMQQFCLGGSMRHVALPVTGVMSMVLHHEAAQLSCLYKSMLCLSRLSWKHTLFLESKDEGKITLGRFSVKIWSQITMTKLHICMAESFTILVFSATILF